MSGFEPCILCASSLAVFVLSLLAGLENISGFSQEPEFAEKVPNITVAVGREAILPCVVDHLASYKVAWIKVDTQTILTIHTHVISHNSRIGASHNTHRIWNLHIRQVQEDDRGLYMCQINTSPMKKQYGFIDVVVPPDIIYKESSSDAVVVEGSNAVLTCKATGYPQPNVTWRREDGKPIILRTPKGDKAKVNAVDGEMLNISKVTRKHMGAYLCIASNGVPPSISKRIYLQINFKPKVKVVNQVVGAPMYTDVTLECHIEASPKPVNYWTRENGKDILISSSKYQVTELTELYETIFQLKIRYLEDKDFGAYNCTSKNLLGESDASVRLLESSSPHNRTFSPQKALDSFKHSFVNELDMFPGTERQAESSKTSAGLQAKAVKKASDDGNNGPKSQPASSSTTRPRMDWFVTLIILILKTFTSHQMHLFST